MNPQAIESIGNETAPNLSKSAQKRLAAQEHNQHFEVVAGLERHFDVVAQADPRQAINLAQSLANNPMAGSRFHGKQLRSLATTLFSELQIQEAREAAAKPLEPVEEVSAETPKVQDEPGAVEYLAEPTVAPEEEVIAPTVITPAVAEPVAEDMATDPQFTFPAADLAAEVDDADPAPEKTIAFIESERKSMQVANTSAEPVTAETQQVEPSELKAGEDDTDSQYTPAPVQQ